MQPTLDIFGNGACTFKEWSSAMANCKEECVLSLVSQPDTRTQNLCTFSALSSLTFSSATWRHQLKSCSLPRQANKCSFVSDYCLAVFVYFLLMVLTKVGTWYRISLEYNTCLCFVNKLFIHFSILRTCSLFPPADPCTSSEICSLQALSSGL